MKTSLPSAPRKGFTLIELLIVIAILGVLGGISYPFIISQIKESERTAAEQVCMDIVEGISRFTQDNNGAMPYDPGMAEPDSNDQVKLSTIAGKDARLVEILTDREQDDDNRINQNKEIYLRADEKDDGKKANGLYVNDQGASFYDPWGMPYHIVLCVEDEGCMDPYTQKRYRNKKSLVYSLGPDKLGAAPEARPAKAKKPRNGKKDKKGEPAPASTRDEDLADQIEDNVYSWKKAQ